ncbi:MAG: hypothetical protein ACLUHE_08960 [Christensenellales bacterium]
MTASANRAIIHRRIIGMQYQLNASPLQPPEILSIQKHPKSVLFALPSPAETIIPSAFHIRNDALGIECHQSVWNQTNFLIAPHLCQLDLFAILNSSKAEITVMYDACSANIADN